MEALEALKKRRSVRHYQEKPVARERLEQLVDAGRLAASAINIQPWEFVVVTEPAARKRLADTTDHGKFIAEAGACIVVAAKESKYYLEDGAAATQNILVAAAALGLGTCWVAGDKKPYGPEILQQLGFPGGYRLVSLIAVGYPAQAPALPSKRPLAEVLHWEKF